MKKEFLTTSDLNEIIMGRAKLTDFFPKPVPRIKSILVEGETEKPNESREFTKAATLLNDAFKTIIPRLKVNNVHSRLRSMLAEVKNHDLQHKRGLRNVQTALLTEAGKEAFKSFEFQHKNSLNATLIHPYEFDKSMRIFSIKNLSPKQDINSDPGSNRVGFQLFRVNVDFENAITDIHKSEEVLLHPDSCAKVDVELKIIESTLGEGIDIYMLQILFYEQVNGTLYLRTRYNIARIIGVG